MEGIVSVACITVICYLIGLGAKVMPKFKDEYIPLVVGFSGLILGIVAMYVAPDIIPATNVIDAAAIGIVSGLAATGINQLGRQLMKSGENE